MDLLRMAATLRPSALRIPHIKLRTHRANLPRQQSIRSPSFFCYSVLYPSVPLACTAGLLDRPYALRPFTSSPHAGYCSVIGYCCRMAPRASLSCQSCPSRNFDIQRWTKPPLNCTDCCPLASLSSRALSCRLRCTHRALILKLLGAPAWTLRISYQDAGSHTPSLLWIRLFNNSSIQRTTLHAESFKLHAPRATLYAVTLYSRL